jgi:hypothetical protein
MNNAHQWILNEKHIFLTFLINTCIVLFSFSSGNHAIFHNLIKFENQALPKCQELIKIQNFQIGLEHFQLTFKNLWADVNGKRKISWKTSITWIDFPKKEGHWYLGDSQKGFPASFSISIGQNDAYQIPLKLLIKLSVTIYYVFW